MLIKSIAFFIIIVLSASLCEAQTLSLTEAINLARNKNPDILSFKKLRDSAEAKAAKTLSLDDPKLTLEYDQIPSGSRNLEEGMKMYGVEQMVMFPGKIYAEWKMANAEAAMLKARYQGKVLDILSKVKSAYYELFFADRSIEIMGEVADLTGNMKKAAEAKYIVGQVSQADLLQASIEYQLSLNDLVTMRQERDIKEERLKALLAMADNGTLETESDLSLPALQETEDVIEKTSLNKRPELIEMKAGLEMKDNEQLKAKMEYFPDTMLGVKKRAGDGWDAMFSFSIPLYFWKQNYGLSSAGLEREAAEAAVNNMKNMTKWEIKEAFVMMDSARRTKELYEKSILPQSFGAFKAALSAYQTGKTEFQGLLAAERMYKEAKLKLYENQVNYGKAIAEIERLTGGDIK